MPKFHDPAPYDIDEHAGYEQIFDSKSFTGWDADPNIWRVEGGVMVGETLEGKSKGNNYIVYRGGKTRDFDLKLQRNPVVVRDRKSRQLETAKKLEDLSKKGTERTMSRLSTTIRLKRRATMSVERRSNSWKIRRKPVHPGEMLRKSFWFLLVKL